MGNCGDSSEAAKPNVQAAQQVSNIKQCQPSRPPLPMQWDSGFQAQHPTNTTSNPTKQEGSKTGNLIAEQQLKRHNEYRAKHHAQPLVISEWLMKRAQEWADHLEKTNQFEHSDCRVNGKSVGENIYWTSGQPRGGDATKAWYDQIKDYQYGKGQATFNKTGHFSQVVWMASKQVGFGYAGGNVVANYYPAGNLMGSWQKNVMKP